MNRGLRLPVFLSIYNMSLKFRKLTLKYAYLSLEDKETNQICKNVEPEIREYIKEHYPDAYKKIYLQSPPVKPLTEEDNIVTPPSDTIESHEEANIPIQTNPEVKKLYRQVVELTHPDKTGTNDYSEEFANATAAYKENDLGKLVEIGALMGIEFPPQSIEALQLLKKSVDTLQNKIVNKQKTTGWAWHNAQNDEERNRIVQYIIEQQEKDNGQN